jgi:hypothetical protein
MMKRVTATKRHKMNVGLVPVKYHCKTQKSKLKVKGSTLKVFSLNKAQALKHKHQPFIKPKIDGSSGVYVTAGSTTWLDGSELFI